MIDALFDGPIPPMHASLIMQRGADAAQFAAKLRMAAACADQITVILPVCTARRIVQALLRDDLSTKTAAPPGVLAGGGASASFDSIRDARGGGGLFQGLAAPVRLAVQSSPAPLMSAELQGEAGKARAKLWASVTKAAISALYLGMAGAVPVVWVWLALRYLS